MDAVRTFATLSGGSSGLCEGASRVVSGASGQSCKLGSASSPQVQKEANVLSDIHVSACPKLCVLGCVLLLCAGWARGEDKPSAPPEASRSTSAEEIQALTDAVRELQGEVHSLTTQVQELRADQQRTSAETRELRSELERANSRTPWQFASSASSNPDAPSEVSKATSNNTPQISFASPEADGQNQSLEQRLSRLEENQQLMDTQISEQSQTKVESASKYRVRLSGIVLMNLFANRGTVDSQDVPELATQPASFESAGTFGASLRQSQIGLEAFGPDVAGAHTSADIKFDFAGGFPYVSNGTSFGIMRLRTGTIRLDWTNTSIIAGQDQLFFAPLAPTSLASLAVPPLAYAGNLWSWTPQVRVEHRFALTDNSSLLLEGGILDSLTGEPPYTNYERPATSGEQSGQPAYATRVAWRFRVLDQDVTTGAGGYYARQNWGFGRNVDGWVGMSDLSLPLGKFFQFAGEFYRGRAVGGLSGAFGQDVLFSGPFYDPATSVKGLDSMGGWTQVKFKPTEKFEVNGAVGLDNPFAGELRRFPQTATYYGTLISKNWSPFVNFIYQLRSDILFSAEYRRLQTFQLDKGSNSANHVTLSLGYLF